jgi:hypothetical protein
VDDTIGFHEYLSPRLTRSLSRLGVDASFEKAAAALTDLFGDAVRVSSETSRQRCERVAKQAQKWEEPAAEQSQRFDPCHGPLELCVDAGKVRTKENGWKDLKIEVWARRKPAEAAQPADWRKRRLPAIGPRLVRADIAPHAEFTKSWPEQLKRLHGTPSELSFRGDGADWIWNDRKTHLDGSTGTLDVWHGSEKFHEAGKALHGVKGTVSREWGDRVTNVMVAEGWEGVKASLDEALATAPKAAQTALYETRAYFFKKQEYLDYKSALAEGRPIGSGVVEGEANQMNRRLKASGVAWRSPNVRAMASLCAIFHSGLWHTFWNRPT